MPQDKKKATASNADMDALKRIEELETELTKAYEQVEEMQASLEAAKEKELRALADLQNVRRRMEEDRGRLLFESGKQILEAILPSLDNFDRALENLPVEIAENEWVKGVLSVERHMYGLLQAQGLEEISEVDVPLDPYRHEAVMNDPEGEQGKVSKVLQKGFLYHGKVLRPAQVAVGAK